MNSSNAIATYCTMKEKIKNLKSERSEILKPLIDEEIIIKDKLYQWMKQKGHECIELKNMENPKGEQLYLKICINQSKKMITEERICNGINNLKIVDHSPITISSEQQFKKFINLIYDGIRSECSSEKEVVQICTIRFPKNSKKEIGFEILTKDKINLDAYNEIERLVNLLIERQNEINTRRKKYSATQKEFVKVENEVSSDVALYLKTQEDQKRKLRFSYEDQDSKLMMLKCKTTSGVRVKKHMGLRQVKTIIEDAVIAEEKSKDNSSEEKRVIYWDEFKPFLIRHIIENAKKFEKGQEETYEKDQITLSDMNVKRKRQTRKQ